MTPAPQAIKSFDHFRHHGSLLLHDETDLTALIRSAADGDRDAFVELYDRTSAKLLAIALRILRDRDQAEDVLQEVFIRVWQNARTYSPEAGRPMTWLITIVRNRAIDVVRSRREVTMPQDEAGRDLSESLPEPRNREAEFILNEELRRCLDRLEEQQRRCLLDAYYDGLTRDELARRYHRPVNTVKTWLHRSSATLRACLREGAA